MDKQTVLDLFLGGAVAMMEELKKQVKAEVMAELNEVISSAAQLVSNGDLVTKASLLHDMNDVADDFISANDITTSDDLPNMSDYVEQNDLPDMDDFVKKDDFDDQIENKVREVVGNASITTSIEL